MRRRWLWFLVVVVGCTRAPAGDDSATPLTVGSKKFTESVILAEMVAQLAEEMPGGRLRHERYVKSRLELTALGDAILVWKEDFSRHNPIHRWWGGTELINDRLWRWDPRFRALIAP